MLEHFQSQDQADCQALLLQYFDFFSLFTLFFFSKADACLIALGSTLIFAGGAVGRTQYADYPSKVYTMNVSSPLEWKDDLIPPLLGERKWHGCTLANLNNEVRLRSYS